MMSKKVRLSFSQYALIKELKQHGKLHYAALNSNTVGALIRLGIVQNKKGNISLKTKFKQP